MSSSTEEYSASESRSEPQVRMDSRVRPTKSAVEHFQEYGRQRPGVVALWCFGIGFVLGWKLKLW